MIRVRQMGSQWGDVHKRLNGHMQTQHRVPALLAFTDPPGRKLSLPPLNTQRPLRVSLSFLTFLFHSK